MPRASLVLPTRNRARVLARTLAALTHQRERDFEVVIADDGSDDDTPAVVRSFEARLDVRYLRRAHRGIAAARSAAMRAARGAILIQTDDDRVAAPDFVGDHLAAHADGVWVVAGHQRGLLAEWAVAAELPAVAVAAVLARDPSLASAFATPGAELVSPEAVEADLDGALARLGVGEPWWDRHGGTLVGTFGPTLDGYMFPWALAIGGNTSVPADLAASVGHLDEQFVGWGLEDTDFHFRLCQAGARVKVVPGAVSYHQLHRRGPELGRQWRANAIRLLDKHPDLALSSYVVAVLRQMPLVEASTLAAATCAAAPEVRAELARCHRELVASR